MKAPLPAALQPTAADRARDSALAAEAKAILKEVEDAGGGRVKINTETYNSVTFGPDGKPIARVVNGVAQQSPAEESVARAQAAANHQIVRMENDLQRMIDERDEITGYEPDGTPRYARAECARQILEKRIRQLRLGLVNQKRLNERQWREAAAPAVRQEEQDKITWQELANELESKGRIQRTRSW